ncbi:BNR-4 repeat-containing protein [Bacteroidota bacterium]
MIRYRSEVLFLFIAVGFLSVQNTCAQPLNNTKVDGYRGIWFELNQKFEYGDKYSGGLGTYTAKHIPLAIYTSKVDKTFFVYGGTTSENDKHLLCMIGYYDHKKNVIPKPTVVFDKQGVDDPHDNPSLLIDDQGYIWVFVSGRGRGRPGFKYKSELPYDISSFHQISEEEMTYPQPRFVSGEGYFHFFTKYTGIRELYFETSIDGINWTTDRKLSGIREDGDQKGGHYQVSGQYGNKLGTFFNRHPNGDVDKRTDLYYVQTTDFGGSWTSIEGEILDIPLSDVDNSARVTDYQSLGKNVYLKDLNFDKEGNPVCLYITSGGHEPGPENEPREWRITRWNGKKWITSIICESDHNYDMGSLFIDGNSWTLVAPSIDGPQKWGTGGEIAYYISEDNRITWSLQRQVTRNSSLNHCYLRRPVNAKDPFLYFWADGNPDQLSISRLYFGDSQGNVWQLPYDMEYDVVTPTPVKY